MSHPGSYTHNHHWSESNITEKAEHVFRRCLERKILLCSQGFEVGMQQISQFAGEVTITTRKEEKTLLSENLQIMINVIGLQKKYVFEKGQDGAPDSKAFRPRSIRFSAQYIITDLDVDHPDQFSINLILEKAPAPHQNELREIMDTFCKLELRVLVLSAWVALRQECNVPSALQHAEVDKTAHHYEEARRLVGWLIANMHTKVKKNFQMTWKQFGLQIGGSGLKIIPVGLMFGFGAPFILATALAIKPVATSIVRPKGAQVLQIFADAFTGTEADLKDKYASEFLRYQDGMAEVTDIEKWLNEDKMNQLKLIEYMGLMLSTDDDDQIKDACFKSQQSAYEQQQQLLALQNAMATNNGAVVEVGGPQAEGAQPTQKKWRNYCCFPMGMMNRAKTEEQQGAQAGKTEGEAKEVVAKKEEEEVTVVAELMERGQNTTTSDNSTNDKHDNPSSASIPSTQQTTATTPKQTENTNESRDPPTAQPLHNVPPSASSTPSPIASPDPTPAAAAPALSSTDSTATAVASE